MVVGHSHDLISDVATKDDIENGKEWAADSDQEDGHWLARVLSSSQQMDTCESDKKKFPDYDPEYFDEYCSNYVVCAKKYNKECEPVSATGYDAQQVRMIESMFVGIPLYLLWVAFGAILGPYVMCVYLNSNAS
jgi:hypothetical protein